MRISIEEATELVHSAVSGEEIHEVGVANGWDIRFSNDLWLLSQSVVCSGEDRINALLARAEPDVLTAADPEDVAKSLLLVSYMKRPVTECSVASDGMLTLVFDPSRILRIPTDVDIVDWQWCLSPSGNGDPESPFRPTGPYTAPFIVACLWAGELEVPGR